MQRRLEDGDPPTDEHEDGTTVLPNRVAFEDDSGGGGGGDDGGGIAVALDKGKGKGKGRGKVK